MSERIVVEMTVCSKCRKVDSFRVYKRRGDLGYARCQCGHKVTIHYIICLREIKRL